MRGLLVLDTSGQYCSATLVTENDVFVKNTSAPMRHGSVILRFCDEVLSLANVPCSELSAVAFVEGPGSFTGVRIAASVAQGIAVAWNLKMMALPGSHYGETPEDYEAYQRNDLAKLAVDYWQQNKFIVPEEASPVYLNDIYDE